MVFKHWLNQNHLQGLRNHLLPATPQGFIFIKFGPGPDNLHSNTFSEDVDTFGQGTPFENHYLEAIRAETHKAYLVILESNVIKTQQVHAVRISYDYFVCVFLLSFNKMLLETIS